MNLITDSKDERLVAWGDAIASKMSSKDYSPPGFAVVLIESLREALVAKEEAEARACRMREAFSLRLKEGYSYLDTIFALEKALTSSAPCRHEEEAKRLRELIQEKTLYRIIATKLLYGLPGDASYIAKNLSEELRRIAEGGR